MESNQSEVNYENQRLTKVVSLAKQQLEQSRNRNEVIKQEIIEAKKDMRENTVHSIANLWSSDGFEALAEMSQYANPVMDKIVDYEEVERKIEVLENLIKSPYFARIDFRFENEDTFEKIYIGRSSLKKDDTYEMMIYDWRSPIASVFYRFTTGDAYYDSPGGKVDGELALKRQYEISNSKLEYFFDADIQIVDEFLRKLLSQNTSTKMKAIVETIQKDQDIVIRDMENDLMMVQGAAGSGKTSIALHRAAYLMYQGLSSKLSANNIMIISPNAIFEQYISHVLPELGEENVLSVVFDEMMSEILQNEQIQSRNQFLENLITSASRDMIKRSIEFKTSPQFIKMLDAFIEDLPKHFINFKNIYYKGQLAADKKLLKKKVCGRKETPVGMKLKQLEDFILEQITELKGKRLRQSEESSIRQDLQKFTKLDILSLYGKLFSDREYLISLAGDGVLPPDIEEMITFTQENLESSYLYYDDAAVLTYLTLKINGTNRYRNIKQVVIDEAQDYYQLHYEIFQILFGNTKFTVLGDINQTLKKEEDLSIYEQIGQILKKKRSSLVTMDKSFRCTNEILKYSEQFIDPVMEIKSFNRQGDKPEVYAADDPHMLADKIISEVKVCLEAGYQSIGLICKSGKNARLLYTELKNRLDVTLIKNEGTANLQGVFIIPVYLSKGLEFDAVLICDANAGHYHSQDDKKLLYIACTRALHRLNLFYSGEASPLLTSR